MKKQCVTIAGRSDGWGFVEVYADVQGGYLPPRHRVEGVDVAVECPA